MPNRMIKESIRTSKKVNSLSDFEFRVWTYLITYVDDFGRGSADPELLKSFIFPRRHGITEEQIRKTLSSLARTGMINLYEVDGESFFCFPNWSEHQTTRAKNSKFPAPAYDLQADDMHVKADDIHAQAHESRCMQMQANVSVNENDNEKRKRETRNDIRFSRNENENENVTRTGGVGDGEEDEAVKTAIQAYCGKINPMPSQRSLEELAEYVETVGLDVCLRAFDIALDAKAANWNYIRAILRNAKGQGVRCLADFEALDQAHQDEANAKRYGKFFSNKKSRKMTPEEEYALRQLFGEDYEEEK